MVGVANVVTAGHMRMLPSGDVLPIARKSRDAPRAKLPGSEQDAAASVKSFGGLKRVRRAQSVMEWSPAVARRVSSLGRSDLDSPSPSVTNVRLSTSVLTNSTG